MRDADQFHVGKHDAGALVAVIKNDVDAFSFQLGVKRVGGRFDGFTLVVAHRYDADGKGGNGRREENPLLVIALLNGGADHSPIHARGKDVIVIGGGDTGTDCVGTALRHGCRSVTQIEIMARPPVERASDNPWPEWPKVYRMDYGQEEAAARHGDDPRVYLTTVRKFAGGDSGSLESIVTVDVKWQRNEKGAVVPVEVPGTEQVRPAQLALLAMGFLGPEQSLLKDIGVACDARSNVEAEYGHYATSVKGVFSAGDCRRGQSLVVWAINEGRGAAAACDRFLSGK